MPPLLRWLIPAVAVFSSALAAHAAPDSVVTLNEIFYHPPDPLPPATTAAPEWIELHNQMSIRVDLGGWSLRGGIDYTFPEGTVMEPGAYLVVSAIAGSPPGALGPITGSRSGRYPSVPLQARMMCAWRSAGRSSTLRCNT